MFRFQAKLDEVMLEYCPDEMTDDQKAEWARHQQPVSEQEQQAIDAVLGLPANAEITRGVTTDQNKRGEERGNLLYNRYAAAFPAGYREAYSARAAVGDVELMESLTGPEGLAMSLYRPLEAAPGSLRFKALC